MNSKKKFKFSVFKFQDNNQKPINKSQKSPSTSNRNQNQKPNQKTIMNFNVSNHHLLSKKSSKEKNSLEKNKETSKEKLKVFQSKQQISSSKPHLNEYSSSCSNNKPQNQTTITSLNFQLKYFSNIIKKVPIQYFNSTTIPCTTKHSRKPSRERSGQKQYNICEGKLNKNCFNNYNSNCNSFCSVYHSKFNPTNVNNWNVNVNKQKSSSVNDKIKQSNSSSISKRKTANIPKTNDLKCLINKYSIASNKSCNSTSKQKNKVNKFHRKIVNRNNKAKNFNIKEYNKISKSYIKQGENISTLHQRQNEFLYVSINKNFNTKNQSAITTKQNTNPQFPMILPLVLKKSDLITEVKSNRINKTSSNMMKQNMKSENNKNNNNNNFLQYSKVNKIDLILNKNNYYSSKTINNTNTNANLSKNDNNTITNSHSKKKSQVQFRNLSTSNQLIIECKSENKKISINDINDDNDSNISIDSLSTSRESNYYKNESKKLSDYIKRFNDPKSNLIYPKTTLKFYRVGRRIGNGAFGKVNLGLHILSGHIVAIKSFNKNKNFFSRSKILYEIKLMKKLRGHKSIVKLFEEIETESHHCIIMENVPGGNLLSLISKRIKLPEHIAKYIFKQLMEALKYIHSNGIAHRDIKPDNILIDLNNTIKLCDFGVGREIKQGELINDTCGTPAFVAPEILKDTPYDPYQTDIWSSGVVLYSMLTGMFPFRGNNDYELHNNIISGKYPKLTGVSNECIDLIDKIFQVEPNKRIKLDDVLEHNWIRNNNYCNSNIDIPNLFTNAEKIIYSKMNIDYRFARKEDIVETFTYKNMNTDLGNENQNAKTKSVINSPLNTIRKEFAEDDEIYFQDLQIEDTIMRFLPWVIELNRNYERDFNDETDLGVVKSLRKKERLLMGSLNNTINEEKINQTRYINENSNNSSNKGQSEDNVDSDNKIVNISKRNKNCDNINNIFSDNCIKINIINNKEIQKKKENNKLDIDDNAVRYVEEFGYNREYIVKSIERNELNHVTATYYLKLSLQN